MPNQPVILLTFANDEDAHLDMLKAESHALYDALENVHNDDIIEVKREESASLEIIADRLNKYQDDILIYHYSGHASGQHLGLEGGTTNADGIAKLLASAVNMQLVVLNGCASYGQVEQLLELGVKAVIATRTAVGDIKAKIFAEQFYQALGEYKSIDQSFKQAIAFLEAKYSNLDKEAAKPKKGLRLKRKKESETEIPWGLYYEDEKVLEWRLNQNLKFKSNLRDGSKTFYDKLWTSRYEYLDIAEEIIPYPETKLKNAEKEQNDELSLEVCLKEAMVKTNHHLFVTGKVGRGKTTALLHYWQNHLEVIDRNEPIPIFVALREYNLTENTKDFIIQYIAMNYLGYKRPTDEHINQVWNILKTPIEKEPFRPSVILMLDGLDEIASDTLGLINEIKSIAQEGIGTQIVLTSRIEYVYTWVSKFHSIGVKPLEIEQIEAYLGKEKLTVPTNKELLTFIQSPMILTLYSTSSNLTEQYKGDKRMQFKDNISTYSELFWNYTEAMIAENTQKLEDNQFFYVKFMIRHFIPYLAYVMLRKKTYTFTKAVFNEAIKEASEYLYRKEFVESFPDYIYTFRTFRLKAEDWLAEMERAAFKRNFIQRKLYMMTKEVSKGEEIYHFTQRHYRDFFAAVHILNDIQISLSNKELPQSLITRNMSSSNNVAIHVGELLGEHYNTSDRLRRRRTWKRNTSTILDETLEICRDKFDDPRASNITSNVLTIWKYLRGHFAGTNLERLDLSGFLFDETPLRHFRKHPVYPSSLKGSILYDKNFISQGHTKSVTAVAYSPDGTTFLSASQDYTIKEWNILTGNCLQTFEGHKGVVKCVTYHKNGKKAISGSDDGTIKEWELKSGKCTASFEEHEGSVDTIGYLPDGKHFLSGGTDTTVRLWNVKSQQVIRVYDNFDMGVVNLSIHPNGKRFVATTREKSFLEWKIEEDLFTHTFVGHEMPVEKAIYNEDGTQITSCSYDGTVKVWTRNNETCIHTFTGHLGPVMGLAHHPKKEIALSFGRDDMIKEWDLKTGECIRTLEMDGVSSLVYHPKGEHFLTGSWDNMIVEWDDVIGKELQTFAGYSNEVTALACSPNGAYFVSGASDNTIRLWDIKTSICVSTFFGHRKNIHSLAYSADGKYMLSGSEDNTVKLWRAQTGQCINTFTEHTSIVKSVAFHPNGEKFISGSYDQTIKEWDLKTGKCLQTLKDEEYSDVVNCVAYNPEGTEIASGYNNSLVKIWNVEDGKCLQTFGGNEQGHELMVYAIAYHPNGKILVSGSEDRTIKVWDIAGGQCLSTLTGHDKPIESLAFSPDGSRLISAARDKKLIEWNFRGNAILQTLEGHREMISCAVYSTDGQHVFSSSMDNTIKKWATFSENNNAPSKEKIEEKVQKTKEHKENVEDEKAMLEEDIKKEDKENKGLLGALYKLTNRLTDTVKNVVSDHKDDSIETYVSASGLYLQGADFRKLHKNSKLLNKTKKLMRQYGAIFSDKDAEIWEDLKKRLRKV